MARKLTQEQQIMQNLIEELDFSHCKNFFDSIKDPRMDRTKRHLLSDILLLSLFATISGAQSFTEIEEYGHNKEDMLRKFLELPNGIPSHDTIGRVFSAINPDQFELCFLCWTKSLVPRIEGLVSIDGKTVRGSGDVSNSPIHLVSAWADSYRIVLGQVKTSEKSNEIKAIPVLLKALDLKAGTVISFDAMGCQRDIARQIINNGSDYLMALKGNQEGLHNCVQRMFAHIESKDGIVAVTDEATVENKGHGRTETRRCVIVSDVDSVKLEHKWPGLKTCIMIERTRAIRGKLQTERSYYISSLQSKASRFNELIRGHWGIENKLHWVLDVAFNEDQARARVDAAAQNFALLRKISLNLIRIAQPKKGVRRSMLAAGWNDQLILSIVSKLGTSTS